MGGVHRGAEVARAEDHAPGSGSGAVVGVRPGRAASASGLVDRSRALADELGLAFIASSSRAPAGSLILVLEAGGLEVRETSARGGVKADFASIARSHGRGHLTRRQPLVRAIGRRPLTVVDATAGLGRDAALLAVLGYDVTAVERSPVVAALLKDGLERANADATVAAALGGRLRVVVGDARDVLAGMAEPPDVVYVDPMFPPKRKTSALAKKGIRLVRRIVGDDADAADLVRVARARAGRRVVVKLPSQADPVMEGLSTSIEGKLVRYDVYLTGAPAAAGAH